MKKYYFPKELKKEKEINVSLFFDRVLFFFFPFRLHPNLKYILQKKKLLSFPNHRFGWGRFRTIPVRSDSWSGTYISPMCL